MAQSVSNDALWEKLSEMDKKFEELIKSDIHTLSLSNDSHFEANRKNIQLLNENIFKTWKVVSQIRKQQKESNEIQKNDGESCFNFKFFKVRKTSFIITILGLLVFILTLFCMKQQNDYSLLIDEYYRQSVGIEVNN